MRLLLADDEVELTHVLKALLERQHYQVDVAQDGEEALEMALSRDYDAVILDVMMPRMDGLEALRRLRERGNAVPVLMLTAMNGVSDRVNGLDTGADDYLVKPFASSELLARIRALLRRPAARKTEELAFGNARLDQNSAELWVGEKRVQLSNKEFQLMELFFRNRRIVLPTEKILLYIWNENTEINLVWVGVGALRKKLAQLEANVTIQSVRGIGYVLKECAAC